MQAAAWVLYYLQFPYLDTPSLDGDGQCHLIVVGWTGQVHSKFPVYSRRAFTFDEQQFSAVDLALTGDLPHIAKLGIFECAELGNRSERRDLNSHGFSFANPSAPGYWPVGGAQAAAPRPDGGCGGR